MHCTSTRDRLTARPARLAALAAVAALAALATTAPAAATLDKAPDAIPDAIPDSTAAGAAILGATAAGAELVVRVQTPADLDPATALELRLLAADGLRIDARPFAAEAGVDQLVRLDGQVVDLAARGWQHRLELLAAGTVVDALDLRFGLDCSRSPCHIVARSGLSQVGGVVAAAELQPVLRDAGPVDLERLAADDVALAGAAHETGVELALRPQSTRCRCFFFAGVEGGGKTRPVVASAWDPILGALQLDARWSTLAASDGLLRAGHTNYRRATVDFGCFRVSTSGFFDLETDGGTLAMPAVQLERCRASCTPSLTWGMADMAWRGYFDTSAEIDAAGYSRYEWLVDGAQRHQQTRSWQLTGAYAGPVDTSGGFDPAAPSPWVPAQLPSTSAVGGHAWVEGSQITDGDRPQLFVEAGATLTAAGTSDCGASLALGAFPVEIDGGTPATLPVVIGPGGGGGSGGSS